MCFYVIHDASQEVLFRVPKFTFAWFATGCEVLVMMFMAKFAEGGSFSRVFEKVKTGRRSDFYLIPLLAFVLAVSQGMGTCSLKHVPFPMKVAFKSSKLIPTMIFGMFITNRHFSSREYIAALFMCFSLAMFGFADGTVSNAFVPDQSLVRGSLLLTVAVFGDAIVPNIQEKLMQQLGCQVVDIVISCNTAVCAIIFVYTLITGELIQAIQFISSEGSRESFLPVYFWLFSLSLSAYGGLRCYLKIIKRFGGVAGVVATSFRKIFTIALSYILFSKPFNLKHLTAVLFLCIGVHESIKARLDRQLFKRRSLC